MKGKHNRSLAILMAFLLCTTFIFSNVKVASASTTTWYVSTTGSDSNSGTSTTYPLRNIQTAINKANPGDTIYMRGGIYYLPAYTSITGKYGSSSAWLTISSYPGETADIDGNNSIDSAFHITGSTYVKLQNLNIQHFTGAGVWIDGKTSTASYITLSNLDISNLDPVSSTTPSGTEGILGEGPYSSNVTIDSCKIHHIGMKYWTSRQSDQGIYINNGVTYWTITNNIINNVDDNDIQIKSGSSYAGASNSVIQGNYLCGAYQHGGLLIADNSVSDSIYYNYFYNNHEFDFALWNSHGVSNYGHVIRGNYFASNPGSTLHSPSHLQFWDMQIAQNNFYSNSYYLTNVYVSYEAGTNDYPETYLNFSQWQAKGQDTSGAQYADRTSIVNQINSVIQPYQ